MPVPPCRALPPPLDLEELRPPTPVDLSKPRGNWRLVSLAASAMLPHPDKLDTGGEDACFVNSLGQGAFGVADGVGGWAADGIDPAPFSRWAVWTPAIRAVRNWNWMMGTGH